MKNPLDVMYHEHEIIQKTKKIIQEINNLWTKNEQEYREVVTKLVLFFSEYADGYHHRKEEEVLFPAIKSHPDFILQEIIDEFEQHHEDFRTYASEIKELLEENEFEKSYKVLNDYLNDLLDHIAAENEELFVLADSLLDDNQKESLYFRFMDIDREIGEDNKTNFEKYWV
ncbi:MAG: hemerythrin domain-containing protein [Flavobacteriia bacterium]|nr:hemerythrin domain-containing protein [Flavobacteriia bacterium]